MSTDKSSVAPPQSPPRRCPICKKAASVRYRPFCSKRCADLDLGHWLNEAYRIPSQRPEEEDAEEDGHEDIDQGDQPAPRSAEDEAPEDETR